MPQASSTTPLPDASTFLTSLIDELATLPSQHAFAGHREDDASHTAASENPLLGLSVKGKRLLLTLHVLFPHEFLPALDLLERGCVLRPSIKTRFATSLDENSGPNTLSLPSRSEQTDKQIVAYYVESASSTTHHRFNSSNYGKEEDRRHYEVRLHAWHCSCPAFAFAAFPVSVQDHDEARPRAGVGDQGQRRCTSEAGNGRRDGPDVDEMWLNVERAMDDARKALGTKVWRFGGLDVRGQVPVCKHLLACLLGQQCLLFQDFVREKELSVEEAAGWAAGFGA
ncbi:MAG: hypothetical protein Q9165_000018 [Trypethelium subeluteriae]